MNIKTNDKDTQTIVAKKFLLKHSFRAGAIIWVKDKKTNKDYYVVLKSHTRPSKGIQVPGGRVEKMENIAEAVVREVKEETGLDTTILCPLGTIFINNPSKNYSRLETYYIVRPLKPLDIRAHWRHTDKDRSKQKMEIWLRSVDADASVLSSGQDMVLKMFRQWLNEHAELNALKGITVYEDAIDSERIEFELQDVKELNQQDTQSEARTEKKGEKPVHYTQKQRKFGHKYTNRDGKHRKPSFKRHYKKMQPAQ